MLMMDPPPSAPPPDVGLPEISAGWRALLAYLVTLGVLVGLAAAVLLTPIGHSNTVSKEETLPAAPSATAATPQPSPTPAQGQPGPASTGLQLSKRTSTDETAPLTLIVAIAGAIGGLGIPLKFAWDELSQRAANKRQVQQETRARVNDYAEKYYMPLVFALTDLEDECLAWRKCLQAQAIPEQPTDGSAPPPTAFDRWLYSLAQVWWVRRAMRHDGGSWFFMYHKGERRVSAAFQQITRTFDHYFEIEGDERSVLAAGLDGDGQNTFLRFRDRATGADYGYEWRQLRQRRDAIVKKQWADRFGAVAALGELALASRQTRLLILRYATDVFEDAYRDAPDLDRFTDAETWAQRLVESNEKAARAEAGR